MYVANVSEEQLAPQVSVVEDFRTALQAAHPQAVVVEICARLEADLLTLDPVERAEYQAALGLAEGGLIRMIRAGYHLLELHTFFTIGDEEVRAWTVRAGARAPEAAGRVHSDFQRGFIRAETIHFSEFERIGSLRQARELGRIRSEGKDYVVRDGDILFFRAAG
jgi:ribosome-binding ATPase YchF (GTP1/OBG family)